MSVDMSVYATYVGQSILCLNKKISYSYEYDYWMSKWSKNNAYLIYMNTVLLH